MTSDLKTLTFCFSDIEGSTRLWEESPAGMSEALRTHDAILRDKIVSHGGHVFKTVGDGFLSTFENAHNAVAAAVAIQIEIGRTDWPTSRPIKVRMAIHTGPAEVRGDDYFGNTLNRAARLLSTGHGGQVLLSHTSTALVRDYLPEGVTLRDLGQHKLKDLDTAEDVAMLCHAELQSEFLPLNSIESRPNNLPRLLSTFIGRQQELKHAKELLAAGPLLTFLGTGGTGKTRLALELGWQLLPEFSAGVWFVDLSPLRDPSLVTQEIATALGVREAAKQSLIETLIAHLKHKTALLILDNCEHLLDRTAQVVAQIMRACPNISILATSREALRMGGERVFRIPSLSAGTSAVKSAEEAMEFDAVKLLVDRCKLSDPRFELTEADAQAAVQICRRLDGIPFAIELAASRTRVLSLDQIAERLRDRFKLLTTGRDATIPRQQTLKATIGWSYDLLDAAERELLGRVSVFVGGWAIEAAEKVCVSETLESWDILDGLMRLVDKSLVVQDFDSNSRRFYLMESIRQYAQDTLDPETLAGLRREHARFYAAFAIEAEGGIQGGDQARWLSRMEQEHDNLRAVFGAAKLDPEILQAGLEIVGAIGRFWTVRGYYSEGRGWIESLLEASPPAPTLLKANAYRTAGQLAYWQGDSLAGRQFGEASLSICRELGDRDGEARSLFRLGFACLSDGDLVAARGYFEEGLALARALDDRVGIPHLQNAIGEVAAMEGDLAVAKERFDAALAGFRQMEDRRSIASVLKNLANVATSEGDFTAAHDYLVESLELREDLGNPTGIAVTLDSYGLLASARGDHELAVYLLAASNAIHEERGSRPEPGEAPHLDAARASADASLGRSGFDSIWERGRTAPIESVLACVRAGGLESATVS